MGSDFVQLEPRHGDPSSFRTEIKVMYDNTYQYLGVHCQDPQSEELVANKNSGSVGLDLIHFFSKTFRITGQLALSYGDKNRQNWAFFIRPSCDSSTFHIHLRYTHLGKNFSDNANSVDYIVDDDRHELDSNITKIWWPKCFGFEKIAYRSNYNLYWSTQHTLRSWEIFQTIEVDFLNKISFEVEYTHDFKLYENKFDNRQTVFELGYNRREWQAVFADFAFGHRFGADFFLSGGGVNYKLFRSLSFEYRLDRLVMKPDPEKKSKWIHVVRLTNYFTKDLFCKLFFQTNSAIDKRAIHVVLVYRFQPPFGSFQLAYQKGNAGIGEESNQNHTLFVKLSAVF